MSAVQKTAGFEFNWIVSEIERKLINRIVAKIKIENIIWETPQKSQQVYFLKLFAGRRP